MAPHWWALRVIMAMEVCPATIPTILAVRPEANNISPVSQDKIIEAILRQPGFHRAVGRIHRTVNERKYGRNPNEPLAQGEASADPNQPKRATSFFRHFLDELRNQFRGKPTDVTNGPGTKK